MPDAVNTLANADTLNRDGAALHRASPARGREARPRVSRTALLGGLAGAYALFAAAAPIARVPATCPFRRLTGRRCPLCGLTRATRALTRGEVGHALALHPLAPLLWAGAAIALVRSPATPSSRIPYS